jgi:hypothetical protein
VDNMNLNLNQKLNQKLNRRSLFKNYGSKKIVQCGCDADNIVGGAQHNGIKSLYLNAKNDYIGLNKFR